MSQTVKAIYEDGVFKPLQKVNIKPHQRAELVISPEKEFDLTPEESRKLAESQKKALSKLRGKYNSGLSDLGSNHDKYLYPANELVDGYKKYYQTLSPEEAKENSSLEEDFFCAEAEPEKILKGQDK